MTDRSIAIYKVSAAVGVGSATAPQAVPAKPLWIHWLQVIGVHDWAQAAGFFGAILSILSIAVLLWRWVGRPLAKRWGLIKSEPTTWVKLTESQMAALENIP